MTPTLSLVLKSAILSYKIEILIAKFRNNPLTYFTHLPHIPYYCKPFRLNDIRTILFLSFSKMILLSVLPFSIFFILLSPSLIVSLSSCQNLCSVNPFLS